MSEGRSCPMVWRANLLRRRDRITRLPSRTPPADHQRRWLDPTGLVDAHAHLAMAPPGLPGSVDEAIRQVPLSSSTRGVLLVREPGSPAGHAADDLGAALPADRHRGALPGAAGPLFPDWRERSRRPRCRGRRGEEARRAVGSRSSATSSTTRAGCAPTWSPRRWPTPRRRASGRRAHHDARDDPRLDRARD